MDKLALFKLIIGVVCVFAFLIWVSVSARNDSENISYKEGPEKEDIPGLNKLEGEDPGKVVRHFTEYVRYQELLNLRGYVLNSSDIRDELKEDLKKSFAHTDQLLEIQHGRLARIKELLEKPKK